IPGVGIVNKIGTWRRCMASVISYSCPKGHRWDGDGTLTVCPLCGHPPLPPPLTLTSAPSDPSNGDSTMPQGSAAEQARLTVPGCEIEYELGRGGMGVVYLARHHALNRHVALKMILSGPHADPATLARFRIEAQAAAQLQHPNIVQIHEIGEAE